MVDIRGAMPKDPKQVQAEQDAAVKSSLDKIKNKIIDQPLKLGFLSSLRIIFQSPKQLFFYLPILGLIPILMKGLRRKK